MNRKVWSAVIFTGVVLLGGGAAPGLEGMARPAAGRAAERLVALVGAGLDAGSKLDTGQALLALTMLLALAAFLAAVCSVMIMLQSRRPRHAVIAMARRGRPAARIARRLRLSQDAVRLLLQPDLDVARPRS